MIQVIFIPLLTMNLITRFKTGLVLALSSATIFATVQAAQAAGTVTIEQKSIIPIMGEWSFFKIGHTTYPYNKDEVKTITFTDKASYVIDVEAPNGAYTTINLYQTGEDTISVSDTRMIMELDTINDYRVVITYRYEGAISVESEPSGAPFVLVSPYDVSFSGITPATFQNLPPRYFKAQFRDIEGCITPKPQERSTEKEVQFFGRYDCNPVKNVEPEPVVTEDTRGSVNLSMSARQTEVLAGESAFITVSVRNLSKRTQHDVSVTMQFDPSAMQIVRTLPENGTVEGDLAIWNIPEIFAGRTWTAEFPILIKNNVPVGTQMTLNSRVSGPEVYAETSRNLTSAVTVGVAVMPATGGHFALLFLALTALTAMFAVRRTKLQ